MIKLKSYFLSSNFWGVTQEFDELKVKVMNKSLTFENEIEIEYSEITHLDFRYTENIGLSNFSFIGAILLTTIFGTLKILGLLPQNAPFIYFTAKAIVLACVISYLWAYKKDKDCWLRNKRGKYLTCIRIRQNNYQDAYKAIALIQEKAQILSITDPDNPLPESEPAYKLVEYDLPGFNKSTSRFYDDRIIITDNNLERDEVSEIRYVDLKQKTSHIFKNNESWTAVSITLFLTTYTSIITILGILQIPIHNRIAQVIMGCLALLTLMSFLALLVKEESIVFYDNDDYIIYGMIITSKNREVTEKIAEYVMSKIQTVNVK